jgi:hypothetical protein
MSQELTVQLHSRECACRGALWMLPQGAGVNCAGAGGEPPSDAVVLSAEHWRALGKPRTIEGHQVAVRRASPQLRSSLAQGQRV